MVQVSVLLLVEACIAAQISLAGAQEGETFDISENTLGGLIDKRAPMDRSSMVRFGKRAPMDRSTMVRFGRTPMDRSSMVRYAQSSEPIDRFGKRAPMDRSSMVRFGKRAPMDRSSMIRKAKLLGETRFGTDDLTKYMPAPPFT